MNPSYTLLIVDDEKQNRVLLTELLQADYKIILAKNGAQALERAQEHQPDLILLDVMMPDMDGFDVIRLLKKDDATRHIPVIFVSALDSLANEETGLELGAVDYITKPFHPRIVKVRVRNHLEIVHQRRLLEQLALIDSLSEIPNRRRYDEIYPQEWRRCQRNGKPLSLMVIDIDHFKAYNDACGHSAGDGVLRQVAKCIQSALNRPGDFVARYGGEEFVVVLPEVNADGGRLLAERIRAEVMALQIPHAYSSAAPCVTVSIGGATVTPGAAEVDQDFFRRADQQLYLAKQGGRNRVVWLAA